MKLYVASAGTGKTHTLVEELLALVKGGVPLRRIAAVTFTRKAAEELRARARKGVEALAREEPGLGGAVREVHGAVFGTIHGFMAEALRHAAPFLSLDPDFAVVDELLAEALFLEEARSLLYLLGEDPGLEAFLRRLYQGRTLAEAFRPLEGAEGLVRLFAEALARYRRRAQEVLGPGDLEALALRLLRHPQALARVVERFPHVLVDEYQDTSPLQGRFFRALEEAGARVVAVGDPKQSIYLFRNARLEVFREALGRAEEVLVLDETRRHARRVAAFLNRFVALFPEGERVAVRPTREAEGRVEVHWVEGGAGLEERRRFEADLLARRLLALKAEGYAFGEMAVLVRSRASLPLLERAFRARGVPYVLRRGQSFFNRLEVRDLYHALRLALLEGPPGPEERRSLLAFLRSPFVGLNLGEVEEALLREDPLPYLPQAVRDRVAWLRGLAGKRPLEALKALVRDEVFLSRLSPRARANLDALLLLAGLQRFPTWRPSWSGSGSGPWTPRRASFPRVGKGWPSSRSTPPRGWSGRWWSSTTWPEGSQARPPPSSWGLRGRWPWRGRGPTGTSPKGLLRPRGRRRSASSTWPSPGPGTSSSSPEAARAGKAPGPRPWKGSAWARKARTPWWRATLCPRAGGRPVLRPPRGGRGLQPPTPSTSFPQGPSPSSTPRAPT